MIDIEFSRKHNISHVTDIRFARKHNIYHVTTFEFTQHQTSKMLLCKRPIRLQEFLMRYNKRKHCVENESLDKLIKEGNRKLARKFSISFPYIDNLISFNDKRCKEFIFGIYPQKLTFFATTESTSVAFHLDLLFTRDKIGNITTKLYDEHDRFGFHIVNFPLCQAIFLQHQPMMYMYLSSFATPIVAQIGATF